MSFFDLFRNFFGVKRQNEPGTNGSSNPDFHRESFRNPIWQSDEDDEIDDLWQGGPGMNFKIFSDPIQISRHFQSEISNVMNHILGFGDHMLGFDDNVIQNNPISTIPYDVPKEEGELRHKVLKAAISPPAISDVPFQTQVDTDLDGRITTTEFSKMWNKITESKDHSAPFSGKYIRREIICKADGTIEKKQTIRDMEGNVETILSRENGNEAHVITIKQDKNGSQSKTEDLFNKDNKDNKDKDNIV